MLPPLELNQQPKERAATVKGCAKHGLVFSSPDNFDPRHSEVLFQGSALLHIGGGCKKLFNVSRAVNIKKLSPNYYLQ